MSAEILKEFLVSIGWKSDDDGAHKVGEQIRTMTLGAVALGASLESLAVTAFAVTARISKSYSDIYFQSKKVGSSADNIKAYSYAVEQLGGTAEGAAATLEEFRRKIGELGKGQEKWLEPFIGSTRDAKGALRDTAEMVDDFLHSKRFLEASEPLKRKYLQAAGIGEADWRASQDPSWKKQLEDAKKFQESIGLDPAKLAKTGREFTTELNAIWMRIKAIRDKFLMSLGFEEPVKQFKKYLDEHSGEILKNLNAFVETVKPFVIAFTNAAIKVGELAAAIAKYLGPDTTAWLIVIGLGLKFTGLATVITGAAIPAVAALAQALAGLTAGAAGVGLRALAALVGGPLAVALGIGATLYPTPAGEGENEQQRQENVKRDPDYYKPGHPGGVDNPPKAQDPGKVPKKGVWERGKQWFNDKIGIAPAEGRETVEGQPGGETPTSGPDGKPGQYRPEYKLSDADLSDAVVNTIAGEAHTNDQRSVDAVIHNMLNRVGTSAYGPSANLRDVSRATGQYAGYKRANAKEAEFIRARIRAIASGAVADITGGANEFRAGSYRGPWYRKHSDAPAIGGNRFARNRSIPPSPYAPYARPQSSPDPIQEAQVRRPEVAPQKPVHIPPVKLPYGRENRMVTPRAHSDGGSGIARPGGVSPRIPPHAVSPRPIGHTTSNSVRHGDISLNQKTSINVQTPGDAGAAARAIAGMQNTVNADAIRNMQGAAH